MGHNVLIIGGSGMLGSMLADYLSATTDFEITATARSPSYIEAAQSILRNVRWVKFDVESTDLNQLTGLVRSHEWVINAVGITKPLINDQSWRDVECATRVNVLFPIQLARAAQGSGSCVLQIATDCVYSGARGPYREGSPHDPLDIYGKTKSLGEVPHPYIRHLRCSIIGPEPREGRFLLNWLLGQQQGAQVKGYLNHWWNGVTTLHFAKLFEAIIRRNIALPPVQHVVPADSVSKSELLRTITTVYGRGDIHVEPFNVATAVDRTLATANAALNQELWSAAGHGTPPTIRQMVEELSAWKYRMTTAGNV